MLDHGACLPGVTPPEQGGVIEHVVEVVELGARLPAERERRRRLVCLVEALAEAAEQACHRQVGLAIAVVDRRVDEYRLTGRAREPVAAPQVPVQERGRRAVTGE